MAKRVGPRDIEARLGLTPGERGSKPSAQASDTSNVGGTIMFSIVGVVVAGAAGAFMASGGAGEIMASLMAPSAPAYTSRVAAACDSGWKNDRVNAEQIHCYMTHDTTRLCDPRERLALADKLRDFQSAADRADGNLTMSVFSMIGRPGVMQMGIEEAKSHDPSLTPEQQADQIGKVAGMAQDYMAPTQAPLEKLTYNVKKKELVLDVRELAKRGFLAAADFSGSAPEIVKAAFAAADHVSPTLCR